MSGIVNRVALDPSRVENARRRAALALQTARYHDGQAEAERAKARQLAKTWGFELETEIPLREIILAVLEQMPKEAAPEHLAAQIESQVRAWRSRVIAGNVLDTATEAR